jgi:hypothetical protein
MDTFEAQAVDVHQEVKDQDGQREVEGHQQ